MRAAEAIDWITPPSRALDDSRAPLYGWFADAVCNTCWNAVDRHVEAGHGERTRDHPQLADHRQRRRRSPMPSCATGSPGWPGRWPRAASARATG